MPYSADQAREWWQRLSPASRRIIVESRHAGVVPIALMNEVEQAGGHASIWEFRDSGLNPDWFVLHPDLAAYVDLVADQTP